MIEALLPVVLLDLACGMKDQKEESKSENHIRARLVVRYNTRCQTSNLQCSEITVSTKPLTALACEHHLENWLKLRQKMSEKRELHNDTILHSFIDGDGS